MNHLTVFAVLGWMSLASVAQGQSILCQTNPIIFGQTATFGIYAPGLTLTSVQWQYQWSVGGCTSQWAGGGNGKIYNQYAGTLTVQANLLIAQGRIPYPLTITHTFTVPPPDGVRLIGGDGVPTPWGKDVLYQYQVTCKGQDCVYFDASYAQEVISNAKDGNGSPVPTGGLWVPTATQRSNAPNVPLRFSYKGQGLIWDSMRTGLIGRGSPPGTVLSTVTRNLRIILLDPCGNETQPVSLGTVSIKTTVTPGDPTTTIITHN